VNVHIRVRDPVRRAHSIRDQDPANQGVQVGLGLERVVEPRSRVVAEVHPDHLLWRRAADAIENVEPKRLRARSRKAKSLLNLLLRDQRGRPFSADVVLMRFA